MLWGLGLLVLLIALFIPILAIVLHSPYGRNLASRPPVRAGSEYEELARRLVRLEADVDELSHTMRELHEQTQFLQSLLQDPDQRSSLKPPDA